MSTPAAVRFRFHCPHCPAHIDWTWRSDAAVRAPAPADSPRVIGDSADPPAGINALRCPRCGETIQLRIGPALGGEQRLDSCAICGSDELYARKDFPQGLGLMVVLVAAALSFYFLTWAWFAAWGVLLAAVAIDIVLYLWVGMVTCCYRCKAEYRGVSRNERHGAFDLATAEKYG